MFYLNKLRLEDLGNAALFAYMLELDQKIISSCFKAHGEGKAWP